MRQLQNNSSPITITLVQYHNHTKYSVSLLLLIKICNGIELNFTGTPDLSKTYKGGYIQLCLIRSSTLNILLLMVSYPAVRVSVNSRWEFSPLRGAAWPKRRTGLWMVTTSQAFTSACSKGKLFLRRRESPVLGNGLSQNLKCTQTSSSIVGGSASV